MHRREVILELVENEVVEFSVALLDSVVVCLERIFQDVFNIQQSENVKLLVVPFVSKRLKRFTWMRLSDWCIKRGIGAPIRWRSGRETTSSLVDGLENAGESESFRFTGL